MMNPNDTAVQKAIEEIGKAPMLQQLSIVALLDAVTKFDHELAEPTPEVGPVTKLRGRGRPPVGDQAMSGAERVRRYRERVRAAHKG